MCMNFYSLEAADLSWRAELLPTTKVSVDLTCRRERCFRGWLQVIEEGAGQFGALGWIGFHRNRAQEVNNWELARGKLRGVFSNGFVASFFLFLFSFLFKVVMLKLLDYPSLSHIVIQVPPAVGNKVKKYSIPKLLAQCFHNFQGLWQEEKEAYLICA